MRNFFRSVNRAIVSLCWCWQKLGFKCLTALLTLTEARLKDPRYRQNKRFHEFLYLVMHWKAPESLSSDFINWPLVPRPLIAWPQGWSFEDKSQLGVDIFLIWLSLTCKRFIKKWLNPTFKVKNHHSLSDLFHLKISVIDILIIKVMPNFFPTHLKFRVKSLPGDPCPQISITEITLTHTNFSWWGALHLIFAYCDPSTILFTRCRDH